SRRFCGGRLRYDADVKLRLVWHHGNCRLTVHFYQWNQLLFLCPRGSSAKQKGNAQQSHRYSKLYHCPAEGIVGNSFSKMRDCSPVLVSFMLCGISDLPLSRRHFLSLAAALPGILAYGDRLSTSDDV